MLTIKKDVNRRAGRKKIRTSLDSAMTVLWKLLTVLRRLVVWDKCKQGIQLIARAVNEKVSSEVGKTRMRK